MFIDEARIFVKAGSGGNGIVSFRHEKFVPKGGPDGGDGGNGGSVVFAVDVNENTLIKFKYRQHFKAEPGKHGQGSDKHGQSGEDIIIPVPLGTIIRDEETGSVLADLSEPGDRVIVAKGGRGGKGNARFATSTNQTPRKAEPGSPGEQKTLLLELKLLADVGLVGLPNAGKSTLLSRVSAAHPKIADYPFTTLEPHLGIVHYEDLKSFVMADIPGIIEGAHEGKGLGLQFLRHIERTKVLLFLIECTEEDPVGVYHKLITELELFSPKLMQKPRLVALTKTDLLPSDSRQSIQGFGEGIEAFAISAVSGYSIDRLVYRLGKVVEAIGKEHEE
jgi:GTP-binding protein